MAEITASDISYYNGSTWVSVSTNKIMVHNGTTWVNANNSNVKYYNNGDFYSCLGAPKFWLSGTSIILASSSTVAQIKYTVDAGGRLFAEPYPTYLNLSIDEETSIIYISTSYWMSGRTTNVVIGCTLGGGNITIKVTG